MNAFCRQLVDIVSRTLQPDDRDAVLGDIAESGETGGQALGDVLDVVVRRQAALWRGWRPWATLVGLIPLSLLLSIASKAAANQNATYFWLYANNWDWALLRQTGFWYEFAETALFLFAHCLPLVCWSWTVGFVLGSRSRRIVPAYAVLFCFMLVLGAVFAAPGYFAWLLRIAPPPPRTDPDGPVFALDFYRRMFPVLVQVFLVAVPFLWGMSRGKALRTSPPLLRILLWVAVTGTLAALVIAQPGIGFLSGAYRWPRIWNSWPVRSLQLLVYWPVAYLAAAATWRRLNRRHVPATH